MICAVSSASDGTGRPGDTSVGQIRRPDISSILSFGPLDPPSYSRGAHAAGPTSLTPLSSTPFTTLGARRLLGSLAKRTHSPITKEVRCVYTDAFLLRSNPAPVMQIITHNHDQHIHHAPRNNSLTIENEGICPISYGKEGGVFFFSFYALLRHLLIQDLRNTLGTVHDDLGPAKRGLNGAARLEDLGELFERAAARLDVEEVDEGEFEHVPEDEKKVVLSGELVS